MWDKKGLKKKIKKRLRHPGGMHEWCMVATADIFKKWNITAQDIWRDRTAIPDVKFKNPKAKHNGTNSQIQHNRVLKIIKNASSYDDFVTKLNVFADNHIVGGRSSLPSGIIK